MTAPVSLRITRPEGYEDVCDDLVIEDAVHRGWAETGAVTNATAYVERLEAALVGLVCGTSEDEREAYRVGREIAGRKP